MFSFFIIRIFLGICGKEMSYTWNGRNEAGKRVSSGEYTARMTINGEEKAVRKMMVVK
jgi:hypothetical protein